MEVDEDFKTKDSMTLLPGTYLASGTVLNINSAVDNGRLIFYDRNGEKKKIKEGYVFDKPYKLDTPVNLSAELFLSKGSKITAGSFLIKQENNKTIDYITDNDIPDSCGNNTNNCNKGCRIVSKYDPVTPSGNCLSTTNPTIQSGFAYLQTNSGQGTLPTLTSGLSGAFGGNFFGQGEADFFSSGNTGRAFSFISQFVGELLSINANGSVVGKTFQATEPIDPNDSSNTLATTDFVQDNLNPIREQLASIPTSDPGVTVVMNNMTIPESPSLHQVQIVGNNLTINLPSPSHLGRCLVINNTSNTNATITSSASIVWYTAMSSSITLAGKNELILQSDGTKWTVISSTEVRTSSVIADALTVNGPAYVETPPNGDNSNRVATTAFVLANSGSTVNEQFVQVTTTSTLPNNLKQTTLVETLAAIGITVTLPSVNRAGQMIVFYNSSLQAVTLHSSTAFVGYAISSGQSNINLLSKCAIIVQSDGTNWVVIQQTVVYTPSIFCDGTTTTANLHVTNDATIDGNLSVANTLNTTNLGVTGNLTVNDVSVTGTATVASGHVTDVTVSGTATINAINLSNALSSSGIISTTQPAFVQTPPIGNRSNRVATTEFVYSVVNDVTDPGSINIMVPTALTNDMPNGIHINIQSVVSIQVSLPSPSRGGQVIYFHNRSTVANIITSSTTLEGYGISGNSLTLNAGASAIFQSNGTNWVLIVQTDPICSTLTCNNLAIVNQLHYTTIVGNDASTLSSSGLVHFNNKNFPSVAPNGTSNLGFQVYHNGESEKETDLINISGDEQISGFNFYNQPFTGTTTPELLMRLRNDATDIYSTLYVPDVEISNNLAVATMESSGSDSTIHVNSRTVFSEATKQELACFNIFKNETPVDFTIDANYPSYIILKPDGAITVYLSELGKTYTGAVFTIRLIKKHTLTLKIPDGAGGKIYRPSYDIVTSYELNSSCTVTIMYEYIHVNDFLWYVLYQQNAA